ncbi:D-3-phosphoglycerate dehydrogenase [Trueperella bonasi]|uniref:D-3-phosphoglycerate dehydrogenase n=1 Tax=Trueperella bonasi TaxID=312286 RepID=A0ABT9NG87_9ACTO|nr:2-hydroxyacid dehydrogenase [Trueperella bonasi]MDP9806419.1 D-3-phosphoglycerate dehydrogenase [Trueperella bonasi]
MKILLASDQFVTGDVMRSALEQEGVQAETTNIASSWPVPPFEDIGDVREASGNEEELIEALRGCDIAMSHTFPFTRKVIESSPELKLIAIGRGGPVNVNIEAATDNGVIVTYAPGRNAIATAEHSLAMILAATRQIAQRDAEVKAGHWGSDFYIYDKVSPEIARSTVGVFGLGAIGKRVARALIALDANVIAYDPFVERADVEEIELVDDLEEFFSRSNILTLHARATEDNKHIVNAGALAKMPEGAILVNCARGSLVDYDAVCDALESGKLFAAAFDTLPEEPLPHDHRLRSFGNVTITPHLGGASKGAAQLAARINAADIAAFAAGQRPTYVTNPEVLKDK